MQRAAAATTLELESLTMLETETAALRVLADIVSLVNSQAGARFVLRSSAQAVELLAAADRVVACAPGVPLDLVRVECTAHAPASFINYLRAAELRQCHVCGGAL